MKTHDQLQESLATHLRANTNRMVWTNTQLGASGSPRPDVYSLDKSFARFAADAYEIKVSVPDLRRDITSGKWQSYRRFAQRVWFAYPRGMFPVADIPAECGVILMGDEGVWRAARKPVAQVLETLPRDAFIKLLIEAFPNTRNVQCEPRGASRWAIATSLRRDHGQEIAQLFSNHWSAKERLEIRTKKLEEERNNIDEKIAEVQRRVLDSEKQVGVAIGDELAKLAVSLGVAGEGVCLTAREFLESLRGMNRAVSARRIESAIETLQAIRGIAGREELPSGATNTR